ncbi:MAG: hypothetical protein R3B70_49065, partial [Polyangiaceae bacterium]
GPGGVEANNDSFAPSMSGAMVAFVSTASNLDPDDTDAQPDIYAKSPVSSDVFVVSVADDGQPSNGVSNAPSIRKGDSTLPITFDVAFQSTATNLVTGDTNGVTDVFVRTAKKP